MELPKHTTQVGTIAANKKMYLEDYCISYMKQLTEEFPEDRKQIALYGTVEKEKSVEYAFVYGAALLGKGRGRTDSLTNSQKDEAESIREEYFSDYQLVGVVISTDAVNEMFSGWATVTSLFLWTVITYFTIQTKLCLIL